jgi:hypothetical protein
MEDDRRWELLMTGINACIPEDKMEGVEEEREYLNKGVWKVLGALGVAQLVGNTITLGIAFVVHLIASGGLR